MSEVLALTDKIYNKIEDVMSNVSEGHGVYALCQYILQMNKIMQHLSPVQYKLYDTNLNCRKGGNALL